MPRLSQVWLDGSPLDLMTASIDKNDLDWTVLVVVEGAWTGDRGEEVKKETLQKVANKLGVPEEYFSHPVPAPAAADDSDVSSVLEPGTIMLRKLDWAHLEELLEGAETLRWHLKARVRDDAARTFLEEFEQAVENYRKHLDLNVPEAWDGDPTKLFKQLAEQRSHETQTRRFSVASRYSGTAGKMSHEATRFYSPDEGGHESPRLHANSRGTV